MPVPACPRRPLLLLLLFQTVLFLLPGLPHPVQAAPREDESFITLQKQGIHYYTRRQFGQAVKTLEQAVATPQGKKDYKSHHYLAQSYFELLILEKAVPTARRTLELAKTDEQQRTAQKYLDGLTEAFAAVTFRKDPEQKTELKETYIHLKDTGLLIGASKKKVFAALQQRFLENKVALPITLYLPFGSYTANGAAFEIRKGQTATANLFLYGSPPGGIAWYWWAGGAVVLAAGATAAVLLLTAQEEEVQTGRFEPVNLLGGAQ